MSAVNAHTDNCPMLLAVHMPHMRKHTERRTTKGHITAFYLISAYSPAIARSWQFVFHHDVCFWVLLYWGLGLFSFFHMGCYAGLWHRVGWFPAM